jgi:hypothetical protein
MISKHGERIKAIIKMRCNSVAEPSLIANQSTADIDVLELAMHRCSHEGFYHLQKIWQKICLENVRGVGNYT